MSFFNAGLQVPKDENIVLNGSTSGSIRVLANGTTTAGTIFQLPSSNGSANQVLKTDGSGVLSYTDVTATSLAADNITIGDAAVTITTSSGDVTINSNTGSVKIAQDLTDVVTISGSAVTSTVNITPDATNNYSLGTSVLTWGDLYLGDGGVIYLGNDQDVTLTHVADTGLLLNGSSELQFRDSALKIYSSADGRLNIAADTSANITANSNITGTLDVTGATNFYSGVTIAGDLTVNGTTTTINSNVTTIDDPVIELGTAAVGETFDRGLRLIYDNSGTKNAFIGWDRSEDKFTFYTDATFTQSNVVASGTRGDARFAGLSLGSTGTADEFTITESGDNIILKTTTSNADMIFNVNDGGADTEVMRLVGANASVKLNGANKINFRDSALSINSSTDGQLDIAADSKISLNGTTAVDITGTTITLDGTTSAKGTISPDVTNSYSLGTSALTWGDLYLGDGSILNFGEDQDVTITHVADTGLLLSGELQFNNSTENISGDGAGTLTLGASTEISLDSEVSVSGNVTVGNSLIVGVDSIQATGALINASNKKSIKSLKFTDTAANGTTLSFTCTSTGITSGQMLHLFYENGNSSGSANIDFTLNKLYAGSGTARYLTFTQTGQSATLVFLDATDALSSGWRIINTGGTISG